MCTVIEFREYCGTLLVKKKIMDVKDRVPVWYGAVVESSVVTTGSPVTRCFLGYRMERRSPKIGGGVDDTEMEHVVKLSFGGSQAGRDGWASGLDVVENGVFHGRVWGRNLR